MPNDRDPGTYSATGEEWAGREEQSYGRDFGSGRDYSYSSAREYAAAGELGGGYGGRGYGRNQYGRDQNGQGPRNSGRDYDRGLSQPYRGSYAADGHRFAEVDRDDRGGYNRADYGQRGGFQGDRGFFERAGDEVRSWFGDRDAEHRREADTRFDQHNDHDYHNWRRSQIDALDRDYHEYRSENRSKFENEFATWRTERQGQRNSLGSVREHQEVIGSDGEHVGTVDKVRGDRILLTKNDKDAGGRHHSIPSRWIETVDDKVTIRKTAAEAQSHWRDEERGAFFPEDNAGDGGTGNGAHLLGRSFSGTY